MSLEIQNDGPLQKKLRKENKKKQKKEPRPNQCELYLAQKNRRCAMVKKKDSRFCADHTHFLEQPDQKKNDDRVPCPLDPKHTVKVSEFAQHMKKCNAKLAETHEPWYSEDINAQLSGEKDENFEKLEDCEDSSVEIDVESFQKLFGILKTYSCKMAPLESKVQIHPGLESWYLQKGSKKHVTQQDSLVGALKEANLLSNEKFYVEFGCGKAELSRMVNACIVHDFKKVEKDATDSENIYGYGLVDRGKNRMKMDTKICSDCTGSSLSPQIKRSRIDIQHLDLDAFLESEKHKSVVAISKHLCGVATDLTLKSILNSEKTKRCFDGMVVAMCCRHICDYRKLLPQSRAYLAENGISTLTDFKVLKRIVTWAVCGRMDGHDGENHVTGLSYDEREQLGLIARRMIDESRKFAMNELLDEHDAELFIYAEKDTTLENNCLRITRRDLAAR